MKKKINLKDYNFTKGIILMFCFITVLSCSDKECEENNTGDLKLINKYEEQIEVNFNGTEVFTMEPNEEINKTVEPGNYTADVKFTDIITLGYSVPVEECQKSILEFEF